MSMNLPTLLNQAESRVAEVLPEGMNVKRVMRLAKMAIHKNPKIAECDPVSVIEAILNASQLGLEIDSPIGGAHLVPFKRKCQMIPDYRGLVRLALRSGMVSRLVARPVYSGEVFRVVQGTNDAIIHEPSLEGARSDDDIIGFYAVAKIRETGESVHEYAPVEEVNKIRDASKGIDRSDSPWKTHYVAMGQKTMVKRLAKWLDLSPQFAEAVEWDNRAEGFVGGTVSGDSAESVARNMAERAKETQDNLRKQLGQGDPADQEGAGTEE